MVMTAAGTRQYVGMCARSGADGRGGLKCGAGGASGIEAGGTLGTTFRASLTGMPCRSVSRKSRRPHACMFTLAFEIGKSGV